MFEQMILPLFEANRGDWLQAARRAALELGKDGRPVTVDDVRDLVPPPEGSDPRIMGGVFVRKDWRVVGYRRSHRKTCHKRPIAVFRSRGFDHED